MFLGHLWPVFFRFVGGKGVATALGVLLGLNVWLGLATLVTWLVVAYAFRYSSLAALVAAVFAPFYYGLLFGVDADPVGGRGDERLLVCRHAQNIGNLIAARKGGWAARSKTSFNSSIHPAASAADIERIVPLRRLRLQLQPHRAGERDHRAVVGAKFQLRIKHAKALLRRRCVQRLAQLPVGADAAGDHQPLQARVLQRRHAFRDQHLDDRVDEGARDVGLVLLADIGVISWFFTSVSTAVFSPEKLKFRFFECSIGRGSV